jgi:hypothetical protein
MRKIGSLKREMAASIRKMGASGKSRRWISKRDMWLAVARMDGEVRGLSVGDWRRKV